MFNGKSSSRRLAPQSAGLKRYCQVMPGAAWLELLCKHIPDRYDHLVRYVGWYSNRARGERAKKVLTQAADTVSSVSSFLRRS